MNSEPLSESMPWSRKGSVCRIASSACCTACWPRPRTARVSTQVVWMSVRFRECANSPSPDVAAVRHQIDLGEAGDGDVPPIGPERNVMLQERPRLRAPVPPRPAGAPVGRQPSVHLAGTQAEQLRLDRRAEPEAGARPREPEGEQRFEADRPGVAGGPPDRRQHLDHPEPVGRRPTPGRRGAPGGRDR